MYKIQDVLKNLNKKLSTHSDNYAHECIFLCTEMLGLSQSDIIANVEITPKQYRTLSRAVNKRINGVPLQLVIGQSDFLNVVILENKDTLTPRPETEFLADYIINHENKKLSVLDLCCGSGCIGIALNKNGFSDVVLLDVSSKALKCAKKNAKLNGAKVNFVKSNMFDNVSQKFDLIVSNPPYIASGDINSLQVEVKKYDPRLALDGGVDGYDFYKIIATNCANYLNENGILYLEIGLNQENYISKLLEKNFKNITIIKDLSGINRFIRAEKC